MGVVMKKSRENADIIAADVRERIRSYLVKVYNLSEEEIEEKLKNWSDPDVWNKENSNELMQVGILDCLIAYKDFSELADVIELDAIDKLVLDLGSKLIALGGLSSLRDIEHVKLVENKLEQSISNYETIQAMPKKASEKASNKRYGESRRLKQELSDVATERWKDGSDLTHNKMKNHLLNEHTDENGNHPFESLKSGPVLDILKGVLRKISREDLISGLPKKK
jgi:hypothetical protein